MHEIRSKMTHFFVVFGRSKIRMLPPIFIALSLINAIKHNLLSWITLIIVDDGR